MVTDADPVEATDRSGGGGHERGEPGHRDHGIYADAVRDANELYASVYETYGRELDIEIYTRTGIDEASMRADALAIAEKKPFAVLNAEPLVGQLLADRKIISIDFPRDPKAVVQQAPYRWSYGTDYFGLTLMAAEVLGKQLWDGKAEWAGDESMHAKDRKFGLVYPDSNDAIPYPDLALFEKTVKKFGGGTITTKIAYTGATGADTATIDTLNQQAATPIIARLKDAGVTTVVLITSQSMTKALTLAATRQEYRPEWFCAEWFNCSFDFFARQNDQEQWAHAFGIGSLYPALEGEALDNYAKQFRWYYGPNQGTPSSGVLSYLNNFYSGIHMAGPKLTPQTFQAGLYSKPIMGGAKEGAVSTVVNGYGPRKGMAYPAFSSSGTDASLWWWNPDIEGFSNIFRVSGKGKAMWVDGGKRYLPGTSRRTRRSSTRRRRSPSCRPMPTPGSSRSTRVTAVPARADPEHRVRTRQSPMTVVAAGQVRVQRADVEANVGRCLPAAIEQAAAATAGAPRSPRVRVDRLYVRLGGSGSRATLSCDDDCLVTLATVTRAPPGDHGGRLPGSNPVRIPQLGRSAHRRRPDLVVRKTHLPVLGADRFVDHRVIASVRWSTRRSVEARGRHLLRLPASRRCAGSLALAGADVIAVPVNWSTDGRGAGRALRVRSRGREPRVRRGRRPRRRGRRRRSTSASSQVVAPDGTRLAPAPTRTQDIATRGRHRASTSPRARRKATVFEPGAFEIDVFADRRPDLYGSFRPATEGAAIHDA